MGERLLREYRKTAEGVGCQPWNLLKAHKYLENLCLDNETGRVPPQPPVLSAVVHYQMKGMDIVPVVQMVSGTPVQPRRVFAETPTPAEQRRRAKRQAAAALSLDASEAEDPKSADSAPPPAADTRGTTQKGRTRQTLRPAASLTSPERETQRMPAASLTSPEGVEVRNHHGWAIQKRMRKSGNLAGKHREIWFAPDGTKRAEAAGFIDA